MTALPALLTPTGLYLGFWLVLSLLTLLNSIVNMITFRKPRAPIVSDDQLPTISVLVPARDEENNIEACIRSLLGQNYPSFEVIVLDDNSSDGTYDILCRLRDQDHRLRVLVGSQPPEGWCGKTNACWQLANASFGEYLLFTDADCTFAPDALLMGLGAKMETESDVVSLMPEYTSVTFWEKLVIPLLVMIPVAFLPLPLVRHSRDPKFAAANGAFLFLTRDIYFAIDGHRAVKGELAEDIKFSQHVKRCGRTLIYADGKNAYAVRMYDGLKSIWRGFTRNFLPAFSNIGVCLLSLFVAANLYVIPLVLLISGLAIGASWTPIAGALYLTAVVQRLLIVIALDRDSAIFALLNPFSWLLACCIGCGSIYVNYGKGAEWKGRTYSKKR